MKGLKRGSVRLMLVMILVINALGNVYFLSLHHMIFKDDTERMSPVLKCATKNPSGTQLFNDTLLAKYFYQIFSSVNNSYDLETEQFTIVILTFKRVTLLWTLIPHYCSTGKYLDKVIIIWNDVETIIPQDLLDFKCEVPLVYIHSKENKLTNRFIPYPEIKTDGVFFIDDDRKILHPDVIFAFQSWQQLRHKILGFERRSHTILPDGSYSYEEKDDTLSKYGYSLVLSTNFILHKAYLEMYHRSEFLPSGIREYVDSKMNCEDFAMCMLVTHFLDRVSSPQSCCIALKGKQYPYNLEDQNDEGGYKGLSKRGGSHYNERSLCLNDFREFYKDGKLPLHYTHIKIIHEPREYYSKGRV